MTRNMHPRLPQILEILSQTTVAFFTISHPPGRFPDKGKQFNAKRKLACTAYKFNTINDPYFLFKKEIDVKKHSSL